MGVWLVGADVLARSRFRTSALAETVAALLVLLGAPARPGRQDVARHRPALRERLAADPVTAAFARAAVTPGWLADVLCVPPADDDLDIGDELARVRRTPADAVLAGLAPGRSRPAELAVPDLGDRVADLLGWVWELAVAPDWPRLARAFEADIVARTRRLTTGGWAAALGDLRHGTRWLGDGRLQINAHDHPPRDLAGAQLLFIPAVTANGWAGWAPPHRYSLVYPCGGLLAAGPAAAPGTLSRLLGPGRAAVLAALGTPMSTTQLVAVTGHGLGSVGNHLKVLLDAGLVRRRRAGRSVLYYRTGTAERLLRAQR
ncbi:ArsR/SmtB family transcription factor [Spirilliplanes yamanashiensis]|uniref:Transcriptional regulator n=1 Tax=Spirilliplanes yamanashiensis TaxID=42233 RepID=A0A8J3YD26_9ACTN|nr:helix-turn-helix domain-containing protein [Spirilliplanes yamanashiensis]MDP9819060.1 DNA-binding transcriptional ArsR family regulator [Spirilliplanes yamanashiensis]GIJ05515.1 transcriptional regulator [Spirilliplanes yamanashiensis]